ncbi:iron donor protein CyaY [Polaromonas sp. AET17H-212]|uniref:iron donor protein CyaY n=1 Tax=Polaromonas sp. AET17H-212 TaxID=1977061 RepID=UPI000BBC7B4B|nr:iron donor protein CyaY [Polaromonas sp. AET17H-212]
MTDLEYLDHAEAALKAIEMACDRINDETDADVDNQRTGGMITLTFADRSQIIINLQKPLQEIWMAARAGGFHYRFSQGLGQWTDTKDGSALFAELSRYASAQAGQPLVFSAPSGARSASS